VLGLERLERFGDLLSLNSLRVDRLAGGSELLAVPAALSLGLVERRLGFLKLGLELLRLDLVVPDVLLVLSCVRSIMFVSISSDVDIAPLGVGLT
jgi:hypothetical protein